MKLQISHTEEAPSSLLQWILSHSITVGFALLLGPLDCCQELLKGLAVSCRVFEPVIDGSQHRRGHGRSDALIRSGCCAQRLDSQHAVAIVKAEDGHQPGLLLAGAMKEDDRRPLLIAQSLPLAPTRHEGGALFFHYPKQQNHKTRQPYCECSAV
jgi:hypothetical protein